MKFARTRAEDVRLIRKRRRVLRPVGFGLVLAAVAAIGVSLPAQAVVGSRCGFATLIGVRGSAEPAGSGTTNGGRTYASDGLGNVIRNFAIGMQSDRNIPVHVEALNYPAVVLDPGNTQAASYVGSLSVGQANLMAEIENLAAACPQTNILLAGYSQGAEVIRLALTGGSLSAYAKSHIRSAVLFGAPTFHAGEAWNAPGSGSSSGLLGGAGNPGYASYKQLTYVPPSYNLGYLPVIRSYCLPGDYFCQTNLTGQGMSVHESYLTSAFMLQAQLFMMGWLTDNN